MTPMTPTYWSMGTPEVGKRRTNTCEKFRWTATTHLTNASTTQSLIPNVLCYCFYIFLRIYVGDMSRQASISLHSTCFLFGIKVMRANEERLWLRNIEMTQSERRSLTYSLAFDFMLPFQRLHHNWRALEIIFRRPFLSTVDIFLIIRNGTMLREIFSGKLKAHGNTILIGSTGISLVANLKAKSRVKILGLLSLSMNTLP